MFFSLSKTKVRSWQVCSTGIQTNSKQLINSGVVLQDRFRPMQIFFQNRTSAEYIASVYWASCVIWVERKSGCVFCCINSEIQIRPLNFRECAKNFLSKFGSPKEIFKNGVIVLNVTLGNAIHSSVYFLKQ